MDCKYVRESHCLCFAFHPLASSLFYLTNNKNRLRIVEENLYTGLVINELGVPLREQNLNVDNYILNYSPQTKQLVLTLSNHVLVYSLQQKSLIFVGETQQSKNPCFIQKAVLKKGLLYFSATDHHQLFAINLAESVRSGSIHNYIKFKLPPEVYARSIAIGNNRLAAICDDSNLRVWESESGNSQKGILLQKIGEPSCMSFSKDGELLLIGSFSGWIQVWDGPTLGIVNTVVLTKQIGKEKIQSATWFHYSGEAQSKRFLVLTPDGNVKLFSFYFERSKEGKQKWMGKCLELTLLYNIKGHIQDDFQIRSHEFANFIFFHPGVLLYMVDYYPRIYYPVLATQIVHSFESLMPSNKKQLYFQPNFFFLDNLQIKRLRNEVENKVSLGSVLEYDDLKILKMDYRPKFSRIEQLPLTINKGSPSQKFKYKFLILYYFGNMIRSLIISNICLSGSNDSIDTLKQYSGSAVLFLGPNRNLQPLILILQEDKQTITVLNENPMSDQSQYLQEQRQYLKKSGQIYIRQLKIKIQKVFQTPFRNSYVVLYLSDNLLRFSNNIQVHSPLIDYDVYTALGLRLDYNDIIIDVIWSCRGEIGCVVCLEKVVFINDQLKVMRSVNIEGYVIQGQFIGYTLILTTKVDVQYVDLGAKPLQLYCIQNYQSRYLIMGILADRIIGIERFNGVINCKVRYFNLMQPLLSGYLTYYAQVGAPANAQIMKTIIEGMAPYNIVSEEFLALLNNSGFSNFSKYFIESHIKLYSRSIRATTLNTELKIQRFIDPKVWLQNRSRILDYFLYYEDLKDSTDSYEVQKTKEYENKLIRLVGAEVFHCIKAAVQENQQRQQGKVTIAANFGEQALFQVYYDYNDKENIFFKMELLPFKATDDREWIGINALYLESKIGENDNDVDVNAVQQQPENENQDKNSEAENQGQFKDLLVYYRFDDGKGDLVDDLSDFNNEGYVSVEGGDPWRLLEEEPMELQDKWGKKCPPQFSIASAVVSRQKKISGKNIKNFSVQIWYKSQQSTYRLFQIGDNFQFGVLKGQFYYKISETVILKPTNSQVQIQAGIWNNLSLTFSKKQTIVTVYLNSKLYFKGKGNLKLSKDSLKIGSDEMKGEFTQFRLWRKELTPEEVKDYLRTPLDIVAQKRKRLKMKIKQKKNKNKPKGEQGEFFPSFPF